MSASPDTQTEVDFMILDYLACLAIHNVLMAIERQTTKCNLAEEDRDVDWEVDAVNGFKAASILAHSDTPLPQDLDIKMSVLAVADQLRHTLTDQHEDCLPVAKIGIEFMNLCLKAISKVSKKRWFDAGARFVVQARLDDQREECQPSEDFLQLNSWSPGDAALDARWIKIRQRYTDDLDMALVNNAHTAAAKYPPLEFKAIILTFLRDLMTTTDAPILIQLERGKLGDLSRKETQSLKERVGLR